MTISGHEVYCLRISPFGRVWSLSCVSALCRWYRGLSCVPTRRFNSTQATGCGKVTSPSYLNSAVSERDGPRVPCAKWDVLDGGVGRGMQRLVAAGGISVRVRSFSYGFLTASEPPAVVCVWVEFRRTSTIREGCRSCPVGAAEAHFVDNGFERKRTVVNAGVSAPETPPGSVSWLEGTSSKYCYRAYWFDLSRSLALTIRERRYCSVVVLQPSPINTFACHCTTEHGILGVWVAPVGSHVEGETIPTQTSFGVSASHVMSTLSGFSFVNPVGGPAYKTHMSLHWSQ
jgi:hypothetical protein